MSTTVRIQEDERQVVNDACLETAFFMGKILNYQNAQGCPRLIGVNLLFEEDILINAEFLNLISIKDTSLFQRLKKEIPHEDGYLADLQDSRK